MKLKSVVVEFALAFLSLLIALVTGTSLIGKPLRLVDVLIIVGLGMVSGTTLTKAIVRLRQERRKVQ